MKAMVQLQRAQVDHVLARSNMQKNSAAGPACGDGVRTEAARICVALYRPVLPRHGQLNTQCVLESNTTTHSAPDQTTHNGR